MISSLLLMAVAYGAHPLAPFVAAGDCDHVLQHLNDVRDESELFLKGYCHLKIGEVSKSIAPLRAIHAPLLAPYARLLLGEASAKQERWDEVLVHIKGVELPGEAGKKAALLEAQALLKLGRYEQGRAIILPLLGGPLGLEARFSLAEAAIQIPEKRSAAIKTYQRTWAEGGNTSWARAAQEALKKKDLSVPTYSTQADTDLVWDRYQNLRKANRHEDALDLLLTLRAKSPSRVQSSELAHAYFRAKDYGRCVETWSALLGRPNTATGGPFALFEYALAMSRTGDYTSAALIYQRLATQHSQHKKADTATYKLGYLRYDRGDYSNALRLFSQYLTLFPKGRHADEARWFSARGQWVSGKKSEAVSLFQALVKHHPRSSLAPGAAYWTARSLEQPQQDEALKQLIQRWPTSGYAYFAATRLHMVFAQKTLAAAAPWPDDWSARTTIQRATLLLNLGLKTWARDAMSGLERELKGEKKALRLTGAQFFLEAGDARAAKRLARPFCVSPWKTGDPIAQQLCTPRLESALVEKTARYYAIDPLIPYGIMTAESALDPSVTSIAGARGLMQLMPRDAKLLHQSLFPNRQYDPEDLFSVSYNVTLGTAELGIKAQLLGDLLIGIDSPAAIAAYNGGEDAVRRWVDLFNGPPEFDEFAEHIGYSETRRYVKRVLGFTMAYRWVYGDPTEPTP